MAATYTLSVDWVRPAEKRSWRISSTEANWQLTGSNPHSLHHVETHSTSGHTISPWREPWNGVWSRSLQLTSQPLGTEPPQGPDPQFPQLWPRVNIVSPAWDSRSLLRGICHVWPARSDMMSENHTRAGQNGATSNRLWLPAIDPSFRTLSRTPGSRAIGGKAYRCSLGHVCTMASNPSGAGCVRENHSGQWVVSRDVNKSTSTGPNLSHINFTTSG